MIQSRVRSFRRALLLLVSSVVLLVAGTAAAGGRVEWKSKSMKESDNHSWTIDVAIYLNSAPDVATLPMRFSFQPTMYYERALLDGKDGPQLRRVPLEGKPPIVESVDVGFLDPGNGQIQKRTKFSFKISRGHGFEAGEYDVTIKDGRTDQSMGSSTHIVLDGENEVIDRRAISFSGEKKEKKKDDDADKKEDEPKKKELTPDDPGFWAGGPKHGDDEKNEEVEPKRGCGCRIGEGSSHGTGAAAFAALISALLVARRRRAA
ncbi:MAG TPA: MYXO-CTERM sorting domain-containing protein [Polyangiaceae bacterium]|nr:MYXO-CTERM sorting domain-containing protein [Polyangiaceae bacterium]